MVKKIWIYDNESDKSQAVTTQLLIKLSESGLLLPPSSQQMNEKEALAQTREHDGKFQIDQENPELVISVGGDGTMLSAFHAYEDKAENIRFVGVHTGHLGFYTDFLADQLDELVEALKKENPADAVRYPLLRVSIKYNGHKKAVYHALNESTLRRGSQTMVADIKISDFPFERFRGDGIVVSTPTGSTAYNKSIGGAVMHPQVEAMQMAEIASLNNRVFRTLGAPMIVAKKDNICLTPELSNAENFQLTVDRDTIIIKDLESVCYELDGRTIAFANCAHTPFWARVKNSFIGEK
ncbi:MAG: NAD kinase [Streptococcaceae bacterium]|jgi:NAD+ kinase|nr:NAD kinase [Streptococcaceae bacterium]